MFYLFERDPVKLTAYKKELIRVMNAIKQGVTPVYSEVRNAKTCIAENLPFYTLSGLFLMLGTYFVFTLKLPTIVEVAIVFVINNLCQTIASFIFTMVKHYLRIKLCQRLGMPPTEDVIAAMESLEYQSV